MLDDDWRSHGLWHLLLLWLGIVMPAASSTVNFAVILDSGRPDVLAAVNKAIMEMNATSLSSHNLVLHTFETTGSNRFDIVKKMCLSSPPVMFDAVIDVTTSPGRCASLSLAHHLDAAFMSAMSERCPGVSAPSVRFPNHPYFRAIALLALRENVTREALAIFYDASFDMGTMLPMEDVEWYVPSYMFRIPSSAAELGALLDRVKKSTDSSEFIIAATAANAAALLKSANEKSMISNILHWFVVTRDLEPFSCPACGVNTVIQVAHKVNTALRDELAAAVGSTWSTLSYRRLDDVYAYEAVRSVAKTISGMIGTSAYNSTPTFQCFATGNATLLRYNNYISRLKTLANYDSVVGPINFNGKVLNDDITLAIYKCGSTCVDTGASYSSSTNTISGATLSFIYNTVPHLDVVAIEEPPFVYKNANGEYEGYSVAVLKYIATQLNFKYTIREPMEKTYGNLKADGTWSGMIGEVARGHADVALGAMTITAERDRVVDFTIPYYDYAGLQIVMKKPSGGGETDMFYFLAVFTGWVWLCVGGTLLVTGVLVTLFDKFSPYSFQNRLDRLKEGEPEGKVFSFKESMWFVLGAYTQAGESFDPRATSTRMLVAGFWIFSCIMMAMYTANLAAFLTVSKLTTPISTIRDLTSQTDIKYTLIQSTVAEVFFARMKQIESKFFSVWKEISIGTEYTVDQVSQFTVWEYPIEERYTNMYDRMRGWGFALNTTDALRKIKSMEPWAVFLETPMIKYHMFKDCDLINTGEILGARPYGIVLPNKSPLTRSFSMILLQMQRDRIMENYKVEWWSKEKKECAPVDSGTGIKLSTLSGVFVFLGGGIALGAVTLLVEIALAKVFGIERFKPDDSMNNILVRANTPHVSRSSLSIRLHSPRPVSARSIVNTTTSARERRGNHMMELERGRNRKQQEQDINDLTNATINEYEGSKPPSQWK